MARTRGAGSGPRAALLLALTVANLLCAGSAAASRSNNSILSIHHLGPKVLEQCPDIDFCPQAARCCQGSVDEYGWIWAAVGWSLWFLTLILLCVDKLRKLAPEEPKDLPV